MSENILTPDILDEYLTKDVRGLRVLGLLKIINDDGILFDLGLTSHKAMANKFNIQHSNIGFAGRVRGKGAKDAALSVGGDSLSNEYNMLVSERDKTFELIKAMMAELHGDLTWDNS